MIRTVAIAALFLATSNVLAQTPNQVDENWNKALHLTPTQITKLDASSKRCRRKLHPVIQRYQKVRDIFRTSKHDKAAAEKFKQETKKMLADTMAITQEQTNERFAIYTPEQRAKFAAWQKQAQQAMGTAQPHKK